MKRLVRLDWEVAAVFLVITVATHLAAGTLDTVYAIVCVIAFAAGFGLFMLGFWNGAQRSRAEIVNLPGLLAASAAHVPRSIRNSAWAAVAAIVVVAVTAASLRPFTPQAFGLLVPLLGLGINTLLGSRYAVFEARDDER